MKIWAQKWHAKLCFKDKLGKRKNIPPSEGVYVYAWFLSPYFPIRSLQNFTYKILLGLWKEMDSSLFKKKSANTHFNDKYMVYKKWGIEEIRKKEKGKGWFSIWPNPSAYVLSQCDLY